MQRSERWIVSALLCVSLLTFFFPLISVQVPIVGNQDISGYELMTRANQFDRTLDSIQSKESSNFGSDASEGVPSQPRSSLGPLPLSVQTLPLISIEILFSLGCSLITLFLCVGALDSKLVKVFSTVGGLISIAPILHITIADSDFHTWFSEQLKSKPASQSNDLFSGLAQQIASLAANAIHLKAGEDSM